MHFLVVFKHHFIKDEISYSWAAFYVQFEFEPIACEFKIYNGDYQL